MVRIPVQSSNVAAIGYDKETGTLEVEYKPSKLGFADVWEYFPVPVRVYEQMHEPRNSVGQIVNAIKRDPLITGRKLESREVRV
jgi:KTSC domain